MDLDTKNVITTAYPNIEELHLDSTYYLNDNQLRFDLSNSEMKTIFEQFNYVVALTLENLRPRYMQSVHELMDTHDCDSSKLIIVTSGLSNSTRDYYLKWCSETNTQPIKTFSIDMFMKFGVVELNETKLISQADVSKRDLSKHYICTNKGMREHRYSLVAELYHADLLEKGFVSLGVEDEPDAYSDIYHAAHEDKQHGVTPKISENVYSWLEEEHKNTPYTLDRYDNSAQAIVADSLTDFAYQSAFFIVTETWFNYYQQFTNCTIAEFLKHSNQSFPKSELFPEECFVTEKTYKAVAMGMPFLIVGHPNSIQHLREQGYDVFDDLFDHHYDEVLDDVTRFKLVLAEISRQCSKPLAEWKKWLTDNQHRLYANIKKYFENLTSSKPLHQVTPDTDVEKLFK